MRNARAHKIQWSGPTAHSFTVATVQEWTAEPLIWNLCVHECRTTHVISSILSASQLHFLRNKNAELAVNCIIMEQVALLSGRTVQSLYCDKVKK